MSTFVAFKCHSPCVCCCVLVAQYLCWPNTFNLESSKEFVLSLLISYLPIDPRQSRHKDEGNNLRHYRGKDPEHASAVSHTQNKPVPSNAGLDPHTFLQVYLLLATIVVICESQLLLPSL